MITCRKSTEWIIKKEQDQLSIKENLQLMAHLAICSFCRLFLDQSALINKAYNNYSRSDISTYTKSDHQEILKCVQNKIEE